MNYTYSHTNDAFPETGFEDSRCCLFLFLGVLKVNQMYLS